MLLELTFFTQYSNIIPLLHLMLEQNTGILPLHCFSFVLHVLPKSSSEMTGLLVPRVIGRNLQHPGWAGGAAFTGVHQRSDPGHRDRPQHPQDWWCGKFHWISGANLGLENTLVEEQEKRRLIMVGSVICDYSESGLSSCRWTLDKWHPSVHGLLSVSLFVSEDCRLPSAQTSTVVVTLHNLNKKRLVFCWHSSCCLCDYFFKG